MEYLSARPAGRGPGPMVTTYGQYYDMVEDMRAAAQHAKAKHTAKSVERGATTWCWIPVISGLPSTNR